jgi:hypothetical protein
LKLQEYESTCFVMLLGNAHAIPFPNPASTTFADDLDDPGIFTSAGQIISVELRDIGPLVPTPIGPFAGSTFGFFFASKPANLIPIFEPSDAAGEAAAVDFLTGAVIDGE